MSKKHPWWEESMRGQLLGYRVSSARTKAHIIRYLDNGPGAMRAGALCGGIQDVVMVHSGIDHSNKSVSEEWRRSWAHIPPGELARFAHLPSWYEPCQKCIERHKKALTRAIEDAAP